jgi:hypothetical protein
MRPIRTNHRPTPACGADVPSALQGIAGLASGDVVCRRALSRRLFLGAAVSSVVAAGCAGYQVGNQSLYPCDIRTVYVPIFESDSYRRYLGERLTEAVIKEIELKTSYKVTGDSMADSILSGRISRDSKRLLVLNKYHDPRDEEISLTVQVRWLDRQSNIMREGTPVPIPEELATISESASMVPEVGQSVTTAQQQAIHRLAVQIVGMMETPWGTLSERRIPEHRLRKEPTSAGSADEMTGDGR